MSKCSLNQIASQLGLAVEDVIKEAKLNNVNFHGVKRKAAKDLCVGDREKKMLVGCLQKKFNLVEKPEIKQKEVAEALIFKPDEIFELKEMEFEALNYGIRIHPDVFDSLVEHNHLKKRFGLLLQHFASSGSTSVVKGCYDPKNKGWLRSPLGGGHGMHFYLWWAGQGSSKTKDLDLGQDEVLLRAIRHHDNHKELLPGRPDADYFSIQQPEILESDWVTSPWTMNQLDFIYSDNPIRFVLGRPGSGKTTSLWNAITTRSNQTSLYLTWSKGLSDYSERHFSTFASKGSQVDSIDFVQFLSRICSTDIKRVTLEKSFTMFKAELKKRITDLGAWKHKEYALFSEYRAYYIGRALPFSEDLDRRNSINCLSSKAYRSIRAGEDGVGKKAANDFIKIVGTLRNKIDATVIFPELMAATKALVSLKENDTPLWLQKYDRLVVDEVQDLTLLESTVVVEVTRLIALARKKCPSLLLAGDDGQKVRPSGFEWARVKELFAKRITVPTEFKLEENLRCPQKIAEVIDRVSEHYGFLQKSIRPTCQSYESGGQSLNASLFYSSTDDIKEVSQLLNKLSDVNGLVIIIPTNIYPSWVDDELRDIILTPADVKGLEYQSIVVLGPGALLTNFDKYDRSKGDELEANEHRIKIDQFRVALSRATETLIFLDHRSTDKQEELSMKLINQKFKTPVEDLLLHFVSVNTTIEEKITSWVDMAAKLIEEKPVLAWQKISQAMGALGNPDLPNGIVFGKLRTTVCQILLQFSADFMVNGIPDKLKEIDILGSLKETLYELFSRNRKNEGLLPSYQKHKATYNILRDWSTGVNSDPFNLLVSMDKLGNENSWVKKAIKDKAFELRRQVQEITPGTKHLEKYNAPICKHLRTVGIEGNLEIELFKIRLEVVNAYFKKNKLKNARKLLLKLTAHYNKMAYEVYRDYKGMYKDELKYLWTFIEEVDREKTNKYEVVFDYSFYPPKMTKKWSEEKVMDFRDEWAANLTEELVPLKINLLKLWAEFKVLRASLKDAAMIYEEIGEFDKTVEVRRRLGDWEKAFKVAKDNQLDS